MVTVFDQAVWDATRESYSGQCEYIDEINKGPGREAMYPLAPEQEEKHFWKEEQKLFVEWNS
jgi:hypothetical protein